MHIHITEKSHLSSQIFEDFKVLLKPLTFCRWEMSQFQQSENSVLASNVADFSNVRPVPDFILEYPG